MPTRYRKHTFIVLKMAAIGLMTILAACSSMRRDGPPLRPVDVSKIPDAKPRVEPLSRYGNLPTYRVNGVTYHVKPTSLHYRVRGVASWYGTKFHDQRTSSGEIYNMFSMTAAHKTLPLPTYVQVTNLRNKKTVIVKVNDRGPFATGRLIDLSYAAAKKLDITSHGTAWVEVAAIDPTQYNGKFSLASSPAKPAPVFTVDSRRMKSTGKDVFVQAGTFRNRAFAEKLKTRISRLVQVPVRIRQLNGNHELYRVEVGPLLNAVAAAQVRHRLGTAGIDPSSVVHLPKA